MSKDSFICTKVGLIPLLERKAVTASCPFVHNMLLYSSSFSPFFPRYRGPEKKEENYRSICRARRSLPNTSCFTLLLFSTCTLLRLTENLCYLQHLYEHVEYTSHFLLQYNTNITHVSVLLVTNSQLLTIQTAKSCLQHHNDGIMIIIDTLRDNHLTRHRSICLTEITKKNKCSNYVFIHFMVVTVSQILTYNWQKAAREPNSSRGKMCKGRIQLWLTKFLG